VIQPLIVANDLEGLAKAVADQRNWKTAPTDRFNRRKAFMETTARANQ
jgi:hypothetical protein